MSPPPPPTLTEPTNNHVSHTHKRVSAVLFSGPITAADTNLMVLLLLLMVLGETPPPSYPHRAPSIPPAAVLLQPVRLLASENVPLLPVLAVFEEVAALKTRTKKTPGVWTPFVQICSSGVSALDHNHVRASLVMSLPQRFPPAVAPGEGARYCQRWLRKAFTNA